MKRAGPFLLIAVLALAGGYLAIRLVGQERRDPDVVAYTPPELLEYVRVKPARDVLRAEDVSRENAFFHISQLGELASPEYNSSEEVAEYERFRALGYERGRYPMLEQWGSRTSELLRPAYQASDMPFCQVVTVESRDAPQHYLIGLRRMCEILRFEAERDASLGNWDGVVTHCRTMLILGDQVTRGGILSNYFTDIVCTAMACESIRRVALVAGMPASAMRTMIGVLDGIERGLEPIAETLRFEYLTAEYELEMFLADEPEVLQRVPLSELKRHVDSAFSQIIDLAERPLHAPRGQVSVNGGSVPGRFGRHPDPDADRILRIVIPRLGDVREEYLCHVVNLRGSAIGLAIVTYQREHAGAAPVALDDLVPGYLSRVPVDPFSPRGTPFVYRVAENGVDWVVYSVGPDRNDDQGMHSNFQYGYRPDADELIDICFSSLEFAKATP